MQLRFCNTPIPSLIYPFGMVMPRREYAAEEYKFGFNTQERDFELGKDIFTAEFWEFDSKLGRRWNLDPVFTVYESPYSVNGGNPNYFIDPKGNFKKKWQANLKNALMLGRGKVTQYETGKKKGEWFVKETLEKYSKDNVYFGEFKNHDKLISSKKDGKYSIGVGMLTNINIENRSNEPTQIRRSETWDPVTNQRISQLDPRLQGPAIDFINAVQSQGISLRITQGFRSIAEQDVLYNQGRTTPGPIVTYAKGGQSYHNYGLAFDVVIMQNGQALINTPISREIANTGIKFGFEWGGDWSPKKRDFPHFQMTFGQSILDLQKP